MFKKVYGIIKKVSLKTIRDPNNIMVYYYRGDTGKWICLGGKVNDFDGSSIFADWD